MFCCNKNMVNAACIENMVDFTLSEWLSAYVKQSMWWARSIQTRWPRGGWLWMLRLTNDRNNRISLGKKTVVHYQQHQYSLANAIKLNLQPSRDDMSSRFSYNLIPDMAYIVQNSLLIIEKKNIKPIALFFLHVASWCYCELNSEISYSAFGEYSMDDSEFDRIPYKSIQSIRYTRKHWTWVSISSTKTCLWYSTNVLCHHCIGTICSGNCVSPHLCQAIIQT